MNTLLDLANRFSERLGPFTALVDGVVDRLVPKMTARASCPYPNCTNGIPTCGACCARCSGDYFSYRYFLYGNCSNPSLCTDCYYC